MTEMEDGTKRNSGLDEIKWPALRFAEGCAIFRYDSDSNFATASVGKLRRWKQLKNDTLVDSSGAVTQLSEPVFVARPSLLAWITGSEIGVRWKTLKSDSIGIAELKELIAENIAHNISYWQAIDLDFLRRQITEADSITDIIDLF